ncbi:hypothetical protein Desti_2182 [Desulfomonile tiedjei DSM 6799]|uniref:Uncharacterized protein n=1 Tax=Desulfomonile tiedjei (strain ATCC 49306 / DSM 6799 / DCB-1) TaxID=706587 RepID=I4C5N5_DESTA|nr:hypothetical protein Desti_2182 [Desulfomonile tiedjei DSM 6799]
MKLSEIAIIALIVVQATAEILKLIQKWKYTT